MVSGSIVSSKYERGGYGLDARGSSGVTARLASGPGTPSTPATAISPAAIRAPGGSDTKGMTHAPPAREAGDATLGVYPGTRVLKGATSVVTPDFSPTGGILAATALLGDGVTPLPTSTATMPAQGVLPGLSFRAPRHTAPALSQAALRTGASAFDAVST